MKKTIIVLIVLALFIGCASKKTETKTDSLMYIVNDVHKEIVKEIKETYATTGQRTLSAELIGRIVTITYILKPNAGQYSVERGYLLLAIVNSKIDRKTLDTLFRAKADFSYAYLPNVNLRNAYMPRVILDSAYMPGANFWNATLENASLQNANLQNADFSVTNVINTQFQGAQLQNTKWHFANIQNTMFNDSGNTANKKRWANLENATFTLNCKEIYRHPYTLCTQNLNIYNLQAIGFDTVAVKDSVYKIKVK